MKNLAALFTQLTLITASLGSTVALANIRFANFNNQTAYQILGIPENAPYEECKSAFRKLAKRWHPDQNQSDPAAEQIFKGLSLAWEYISNEHKAIKPPVEEPIENLQAAQAANAYQKTHRFRDSELIETIRANVDWRGSERVSDEGIIAVVDLLARKYGTDFSDVLRMIKENLLQGRATELLVRATVKFYLTKYPQWGDEAVEALRQLIRANLEIRATRFLSSEQIRNEVGHLTHLLEILPRASKRAQKCEEALKN